MPIRTLFPTLVYTAPLVARGGARLNAALLAECLQLQDDDTGGRRWSRRNYPGGYTSYGSVHRMHQRSPTFADLEKHVDRHVRTYAARLELDLTGRRLAMTDCWVNVMPRHVVHTNHLHPLSTLSGTYYVQTPRGCAGLKFEDPRLDRFMAAPPPRNPGSGRRGWATVPARAGHLVLFESWLRHEVPPNPVDEARVSISFNYHWF